MKKLITWKRRKPRATVADNIAARVAANRARSQQESDAFRERLSIDSPTRERRIATPTTNR
jgi:hypothetical protein